MERNFDVRSETPFVWEGLIETVDKFFWVGDNKDKLAVFVNSGSIGIVETQIQIPIKLADDLEKARQYQRDAINGLEIGDKVEITSYSWFFQDNGKGRQAEQFARIIKGEKIK